MSTQTSAHRVQGLDLLRGIAVGLVVLRHALPSVFPGAGVVGVVMFFALSGHLITTLLLRELDAHDDLDLRVFYARRARRLLPALVLLLVAVAAVAVVLDPLGDRDQLPRTLLAGITFTGDLPVGHDSDATFHLWTLAVEEQFYLLWPALLLLAHRRGRRAAAVVLAGAAALLACLATVLWLREEPDLAYSLPTSWALCFVIGSAGAMLPERPALPALPSPPTWLPTAWLPTIYLAALGLLSVVALRGHAWTYLVAGPAVALLTAALVRSWRGWQVVTARWLAPLVGLGTISYGVYLWDYPLTVWLRASLGTHASYAGLLAAVLSVPIALLSWTLVERRWSHQNRPTPVLTESVR